LFESGGRAGVKLMLGAVASYLNVKVDVLLAFPALSVQDPLTDAVPLSGPLYVTAGVQESTPENMSVPLTLNVIGALYQSARLGDDCGTSVTTGAVLSSLIVTELLEDPPPLVALQVKI
jgi:hypothetical protein